MEATANAAKANWINSAEIGNVDLALVRLAPFEAPTVRRRFNASERRLAILGPVAPGRMADILATPRTTGLWCLGGATRAVEAGEAAWYRGDVKGLGEILGVPDCCLRALLADDPVQRPEWTALHSPELTSWQTNYTLYRLGLSPAPWLPCQADCPHTLRWIENQETLASLAEILSWPLEWSALHGIAQVLSPVFRLVHDTLATGRKASFTRGTAEAAPTEGATGLIFPYRPPPHRPLESRRTFLHGIVNIAQAAPAVEVGRVRSMSAEAPPRRLSEPLVLPSAVAGWTAFRRWSDENTAFWKSDESAPIEASHEMIAGLEFAKFGLDELELQVNLGPFAGSGLRSVPMPLDAWCFLVRGRRRWVFCPPGSEADLVNGEPDLLNIDVRNRLSRRGLDIRECEQLHEDVICIPAGWWWQVRDLEPPLAVMATVQSAASKKSSCT